MRQVGAADLSIARGHGLLHPSPCMRLTWLVWSLGSPLGGGRYESRRRARQKTYPGGLSNGVTRVVNRILSQGFAQASRKAPSACIALTNDEGLVGRECCRMRCVPAVLPASANAADSVAD